MYFCEFSEILKNTYRAEEFAQFYMPHSIIHVINRKSKKENYSTGFLSIQQGFNIGELSPKEIIRFENATFLYISFRRARLEIIHQGLGAAMKLINE